MLATGTYLLLAATSIICAIYLFITMFYRKLRPGEPSIVKGHPIWGSAKDFGEHAVRFLQKSNKTYGDVFTIRLINQHLTIVNDPHSFETFHKERNFDFDNIQKQVNWNVFGFTLKDARSMIKDTGRTVRGKYLDKGLNLFTSNLHHAYSKLEVPRPVEGSTKHGEWATQNMRDFASKTMFNAIFNTVFGKSDDCNFNSDVVFENFEIYHKYFNLFWLGFPKSWFPKATDALVKLCVDGNSSEKLLAKDDCSDYIKTAIAYMLNQGQSESDIKGHNLVYLHVNYNTFRITYWLLAYLLEHPKAMAALKEEIYEKIEDTKNADGSSTLTVKDLENMKILDSVIKECFRVASGVFMIRYVTKDTWFQAGDSGKDYLIRKGDRVAIYPPAIHQDPEIFDQPEEFKYDRFVDAKFYKNGKEVKHPVMPMGSVCPGKRYAYLQLKWYLTSVLTTFDLSLEGDLPELDTSYYGHEVLPPKNDTKISYRFRCDAPVLEFSQF